VPALRTVRTDAVRIVRTDAVRTMRTAVRTVPVVHTTVYSASHLLDPNPLTP
jgi:hypothetical protein